MSNMAYTKIPEDTFSTLTLNAGVLLSDFDPSTGTLVRSNIIGATSGGISFQATPSFKDLGEDIDNCPKNTKELMILDDWEIKLSGTLLTANTDVARRLMALADISGAKVTPRDTVIDDDFFGLWLVCDYSSVNTGSTPGRVAVHMMNALSTGGFQIQTTDKEKGKYSFEFTAHYSIDAQDTVPFEVYINAGADSAAAPEIRLADKSITIKVGETFALKTVRLTPAGTTVSYTSGTTAKATVNTSGVVTGVAAGSSIVTASITVNSVSYTDTCTVIVEAAS